MTALRTILPVTLVLLISFSGCTVGPLSSELEETEVLVLPEGRDFRILVLTDIQLGLDPFRNGRALDAVRRLVADTTPDLVLTTGDNVSGPFTPWLTKRFIGTMQGLGIPWAVTLGNHDTEGPLSREWYGDQYAKARGSLFDPGPGNVYGIGNFIVELVDAVGALRFTLILMDSNVQRRYEGGMDYDYIHADQIAWYERSAEASSQAGAFASLAFFHIPLPEFADAAKDWEAGRIDPASGFGGTLEGIFAPPENSGLFDSLKRIGSTTHVFVGHDHINDLSVEYQGIRLTYVLKTGPSSYHNPDLQGGTLVTLDPVSGRIGVEHVYQGE